MRKFTAKQYKDLFGDWDDPVGKEHEEDELRLIKKVVNPSKKTFIDLGAGYGRLTAELAKISNNVLAIEINPNMFSDLLIVAEEYENVTAIQKDISKLVTITQEHEVISPVLLLMQNTLGTVEGDWKKVLVEMREVTDKYGGEVIISLYRQQALEDWGIASYWYGKEMNGEPDLKKTNYHKGLFVSKTGYTSKWWNDTEIKEIINLFDLRVINEIVKDEYWVFHLG